MQQKRRMAAQRERELRNYHQEQQYNRSENPTRSIEANVRIINKLGVATDMSGAKSERSLSPNTMNEDERRELIARQHRALYGNDSNLYSGDNSTPRQGPQDARVPTSAGGARGNSPLAFDPFGTQKPSSTTESSVQMPARDQAQKQDSTLAKQTSRRNSNSSPSSQPTSFGLFDPAQQSSRTSTSSPGGSPPLQQGPGNNKSVTGTTGSGPAPIGTRPTAQTQAQNVANKRSTTPLPSPLSYGLSANEPTSASVNERSTSAASNPTGSNVPEKSVGLGGWGSNSGVWGTAGKNLGVQASVWG